MNGTLEKWSQQKLARITGFTFLIIIVIGMLRIYFLRSGIYSLSGTGEEIAAGILANESAFRLGIVIDFISIMLGLALNLAFYLILKPVNKNISLYALLLALIGASIKGIQILLHFMVLMLLSESDYLMVFTNDQVHSLINLMLEAYGSGFHIGLVLSSAAFAVIYYLFYVGRYIPRVLSGFALLASLLVVFSNFAIFSDPANANFLYPEYTLPNLITVVSISLWLTINGINTNKISSNRPS